MPRRTADATRVAALYRSIYAVIRRIPKGRVATYGQVAELAGVPRHARQVGYALNALREGDDVPWHRVVNAAGAISLRAFPGYEEIQRTLLEDEGVEIGVRDRIDLERCRWRPRVARCEGR